MHLIHSLYFNPIHCPIGVLLVNKRKIVYFRNKFRIIFCFFVLCLEFCLISVLPCILFLLQPYKIIIILISAEHR